METNKQEYYALLENASIMSKLAKQVDTISDILNTYGINDMPLGKVRDFLEERYFKINNDTFEKFNGLITNKNSNIHQDEFLKLLKETKEKAE